MRVDPLRLRQLGHDVQDDADGVTLLLSAVGSRLTVTGAKAGPWKAAGAATGVTDAWRTELAAATGRIRQTGKLFVNAADEYMAVDARSAARIRHTRDGE